MVELLARTVLPLGLLMGAGFLARHFSLLKERDVKAISVYVYYCALPAVLFIDLAQTAFTFNVIKNMLAGALPLIIILLILLSAFMLKIIDRQLLALAVISTAFGSQVFFGLPYIMFAFEGLDAERFAAQVISSSSVIAIVVVTITLELSGSQNRGKASIPQVLYNSVVRSPLLLSIVCGMLFGLLRLPLPDMLSTALRAIGKTSLAAVFMLGAFLYGRSYSSLSRAVLLSLMRIVVLPCIALLCARILRLPQLEASVLVLMHAMPVAVSVVILSQQHDFHVELIASLVLISSVGALLYLPLWHYIVQ
jgi:hypothetical protein